MLSLGCFTLSLLSLYLGRPRPSGRALQVGLMEAVGDLTGSVRELMADSAIGTSDAVVDGRGRRRRLPAGLEAHVVQQGRWAELCPQEVAGMVNALPPAHEVQQAMRINVQGGVGEAADILAVQITVNPAHSLTGVLFDHINGTVGTGCGLFTDYPELHDGAAFSRDWKPGASPPSTKKELGS